MKYLLFTIFSFVSLGLMAQDEKGTVTINGQTMPYMLDECGDTLILATLDDVSVSTPREFDNFEDFKRYRKYRRYAIKVYPYAIDAIKMFREVEYANENMSRKEERKHNRKLQKQLKDEFSDPLKKLTRTQGMILIKMIERELDTPMFELIKGLRNGTTARYWNTLGKLYGHDLKEGYQEGQDVILDAVLQDLDVSYEMPASAKR